jgi:hypothetical protein
LSLVQVLLLALLALALFEGIAHAQAGQPGNVAAARDAYDRGAAAYDAGDYALATTHLSRADALVPSDVALELALKAAVRANDAVQAMELAQRAQSRSSPSLRATREDTVTRMAPRVGRVVVQCSACTATIDGSPIMIGEPRWALVGPRDVVVEHRKGQRRPYPVKIDAGATAVVTATPTATATAPAPAAVLATPPPAIDTDRGVSTAWFWVPAGISVALGAATIGSAIDTRNKYDAFSANPSQERSDAGVSAQLRTNLLIGATSVSVLATAIVGLFLVRWSDQGSRKR